MFRAAESREERAVAACDNPYDNPDDDDDDDNVADTVVVIVVVGRDQYVPYIATFRASSISLSQEIEKRTCVISPRFCHLPVSPGWK